ncbi:MAG: hypothetical protein ACREDJ_04000, partial [Methylocella sp.]
VKDALHSNAASWRKAKEDLMSLREADPAFNFNFVILDTPALILPSQGINLAPPHIEPWNNVAKINGEWESPYPDNAYDTLSFVFAWENPSDRYAVVNVESYLMLNGFCQAWAYGGFYANNIVGLSIDVGLTILEYWNNPPTLPPQQSGAEQTSVSLEAASTGLFALGDYETTGINGLYDVRYDQFVLPPKGVSVFEVGLTIGHNIFGDGYTSIDFSSGDFEVMCPAVAIAILT